MSTEAFTFHVDSSVDKASARAASLVAEQIRRKPDSLICVASGSTPTQTYANLGELAAENRYAVDRVSIAKLDEWLELPPDDPHTCESFLRQHVLEPLQIRADRYIGFDNQATDTLAECRRIETELQNSGGIDIAILGIGINGHIGLNEPAAYLQAGCHVADLAPTTVGHSMLEGTADRVTRGLTMGMRDILGARRILLLAFGEHKAEPIRELLTKRVTTQFPASFLWLHQNVTCIFDQAAAASLAGGA
jgi:galactosamine-6-phosphate isomerase